MNIVLAGNPNAGKSTLFNALTGAAQQVGNWPGVTVEKRSGTWRAGGTVAGVVDLPGIFLLPEGEEEASLDEKIACQALLSGEMDLVLNVVDAAHLERSLYLTLQLLERDVPVIVVASMMDMARKSGLVIDIQKLSLRLGCPVVSLEQRAGKGLAALKKTVLQKLFRLQQGEQPVPPAWHLPEVSGEDADILRAEARYCFIHETVQQCVNRVAADRRVTPHIDRFVLNRFLGIPVFLAVMYSMFFFALNVGGVFQDFFDLGSETLLVGGLSHLLTAWHWPLPLVMLAEGVGRGLHVTLTFVPVLAAMFFFLSLLEDSGYMARAAFVVDRVMGMAGLPGKALVPVIVGFGCNVPAIMAARTLTGERDRILTVLMMPFVPCGARLAIFAVFVAVFFPLHGQNVVFGLYLTGILVALLTGFLLRKTVLPGPPSPLVMELPAWLMPDLPTLLRRTWQRLRGFILRAGRLIVPVCLVLGLMNGISVEGRLLQPGEKAEKTPSVLAAAGRWMTPIFAPMGIQADNWPATAGLVTGILAKEVVIGTLNTLYGGEDAQLLPQGEWRFREGMQAALASVLARLKALPEALRHPLRSAAPMEPLTQSSEAALAEHFEGKKGALAYLLFVLLYFPCVSTLAVMWREVGGRWTLFSVCWSLGIAYACAVLFYQLVDVILPVSGSVYWAGGLVLVLGWLGKRYRRYREVGT